MIHVKDNYYIKADNHCYKVIEMKEAKEGGTYYTDISYHSTFNGLLIGLAELFTKKGVQHPVEYLSEIRQGYRAIMGLIEMADKTPIPLILEEAQNDDTFKIVKWPDSEKLEDHEQFDDCILINTKEGVEKYDLAAYMVPVSVYNQIFRNPRKQ